MLSDTASFPATRPERYNAGMIWLHWATALLVIVLFATAEVWDFAEKGGAVRNALKALHYGSGILLAVVFVIRLVWRLASHATLPEEEKGLMGLAAKAVHAVLYLALAGQIIFGFTWRWSQGKAVDFFGIFSLTDPFGIPAAYRHTLGELHENVAWLIIAVAFAHAVAAIYHHVFLKDGVLLKMMPKHGNP
ncbi:cytochrome b [Rhizobium oryzicola]|uniref:Cytochrome b/b6 domain-containing protein n=1 Tax=Rhizobium oryzicola TaxID=1232668 RepID=A0ABT8T030_9HYPH|nr:cytochrome b/b6 domain-containing protein [Rhizobium oryzicola]MDO1584094.1 cytochrome b/b6 domain-containing protein [Rhizobium oryzicola]